MRAVLKNAFTLVEMLVVIVLLSMLIATAVFAYKNMIIHVKQTKRENFNTLYSFHYLRSSIHSMSYYVIQKEKNFTDEVIGDDEFHYFFKGSKGQCTFISKSPLFNDAISVVSLRCKDEKLYYYENLLYGPQDYSHPRILESAVSKVLFNDLNSCQFHYIKKGNKTTELQDDLPNKIQLTIQKNDLAQNYYFKIKSNRTKTKRWISAEVYDDEE